MLTERFLFFKFEQKIFGLITYQYFISATNKNKDN
jgi:hypothetical protein